MSKKNIKISSREDKGLIPFFFHFLNYLLFIYFYWSMVDVQYYMLQVYDIVIHNF